ncbi:MAG: TonB-dependent receptor plug domain-containing protein [Candidatus Zhuqueibacterota bacterium]
MNVIQNAVSGTILLVSLMINPLPAQESTAIPDSVKYVHGPVIVTGQRFEMRQKDAAASVSVISPSDIQTTQFTNVADLISYLTPGVYTTRRSSIGYGVSSLAAGGVTIRGVGGSSNSQVLMLIDGRPDFQGIFSHPINDAYLVDNVDHIEVLRGPAAAVYGTNAMGGVVNIITRQLPAVGFTTKAQLGYGSFNTQKMKLQHSGAVDKFRYFAALGYQQSDGDRPNSDFKAYDFAVKLGYQINERFQVSFNGSLNPYEFHDPGPENIDLYGYFDYGDITRSSMDITLTNTFARTHGTIKLHGNFGKHKLSDGWDSDDQTNGFLFFQNFNMPLDIKTTIGSDVKRYGGAAWTNGVKLGAFFNDERALYVHLQKLFRKKLTLSSGVRFEHNSNFGGEWIPKFGLVFQPYSQTSLRVTAAKGFRTPSIKDLFLFPPANPDLLPERLWNYEMGVNQSFGPAASVDICGFYYSGDQFIETVVISPGVKQNQNIGENEAMGMEVALNVKPAEHFFIRTSYSYLKSKKMIPYSPNKLNFLLDYAWNKAHLALYGEYVSDLYSSYQENVFPLQTTFEKMPEYTLVHLKLRYRLLQRMEVSLAIENLLDAQYTIMKGYPLPGRTFMSQFSYEL